MFCPKTAKGVQVYYIFGLTKISLFAIIKFQDLQKGEKKLKSDMVLLEYLSGLSPLLKKLVKKATEEKINIITRHKCCEYLRTIGREDLTPSKEWLSAGDFPEVGLEKIILVLLGFVFREIRADSLGLVELGFAHEIGHSLTWADRPFCNKAPTSYHCAYCEALAYKVAFDIFKELHPKGKLKLLFEGKPTRPLEILGNYGYPLAFISECGHCYSLRDCQMDNCPKEKETRELVEIIKKSKL